MNRYRNRLDLAVLGMGLLLTTGCAKNSPPPRFYLLQPLATPGPQTDKPLSLGVGPVTVPPYLDRPQIVTATTASRLRLAEFDRWAEPLQENMARVVSDNLTALLASDHVVKYPWSKPLTPDYQLEIEVSKFHTTTTGQCELQTQWHIRQGQKILILKNSSITTQAESGNYDDIVAAEGMALDRLSREIAASLKQLP